ncbi:MULTISPECIES: hypothetical protein [Streptomyces]|uniref:hypothetical protein n=2 Tax=Streptomyces TaxID=1883 RepID=UPI00111FB7F5|nr:MULTISPECIES: hypothetical protein [Streptomyces]UQS29045.1 hypothetical protein J5J01_18760 [Streptomyces fradiae]
MERPLTAVTVLVPAHDRDAAGTAARAARRAASELGLAGPRAERTAECAGELARALAARAERGAVYVQPSPLGRGLDVAAIGSALPEDGGAGAERWPDGARAGGPGGTLLEALRELADDLVVRGTPGRGTAVCARWRASGVPGRPPGPGAREAVAGPDVGALRLPVDGESSCGDAWAVAAVPAAGPADDGIAGPPGAGAGPSLAAPPGAGAGPACGDGRAAGGGPAAGNAPAGRSGARPDAATAAVTAMVVDGLGHGPAAAHAADLAVRAFHDSPALPLPRLMTAVHQALRGTRGAAVGLLRRSADGSVEHCSVGNVRAYVLGRDGVRHRFGAQPGVVGWNMPPPAAQRLPDALDGTLLLHSDGVDGRWAHSPGPGLTGLPAPLLPVVLAHAHRAARDDVTALAVAPARRTP